MATIFLLNDKTTRPTQLLQNAAPGEIPLREPEAIAGCNCDRWGHLCSSYDERKVRPKAELPISSPAKQTR